MNSAATDGVRWFDNIPDLEKVYDSFKGKRNLTVDEMEFRME